MSFIDRLAEQAKTPEQALNDFKRPELKPVTPLEPRSTDVSTGYGPYTASRRRTLEDAILSRRTSGVGELVKRLGLVLASDMGACEYNGTVETFSKGTSFGPDYEIDTVDLPSYRLRKLDLEMGVQYGYRRDTVIDQVVWHKMGSDGKPGGSRSFVGVFSYSDGCIGFLGKNLEKVEMMSEVRWTTNPNLVEQTLERYFEKDFGNMHDYLRFAKERREKESDDRARYYGVGRYSRNSYSPHGRGPWS